MGHSVSGRGRVGRVLTRVGGLVLFVLGLMFSAVLLALVVVVGLVAWVYFWWRTRELPWILRQGVPRHHDTGAVIEGEVVVVEEARPSSGRLGPPGDHGGGGTPRGHGD